MYNLPCSIFKVEIRFAYSFIHFLAMAYLFKGIGGAVELAPGYLKNVYDIVHKAGADEVQTGFGRTGSHYWGFETQGVIADIVTMAKVYIKILYFY
jgi:4-aminobutyrate aminotransferase-like enzyme